MNDIIAMARRAGAHDDGNEVRFVELRYLERFAALVAAAERNKVAQWMIDHSFATGHGDTTEDLLEELDWQITESWSKVVMASVEAEREACALIAETPVFGEQDDITMQAKDRVAAAIRARGQA
jgi:hypothetical protein